ncbi:MAG: DUF4783 domain-containing protein [Bacteroidia bacterium]
MKSKLLAGIFLLSTVFYSFTLVDVIDTIASAIQTGNSKKLSDYFIENVDLKIIDREDIYSKQQAEMILKDFFSKHPVKSFSIAHKSTIKNGAQYIIGSLNTTNEKFRIYFLIKTTDSQTLIQQFKIENE